MILESSGSVILQVVTEAMLYKKHHLLRVEVQSLFP